MGGALVAFGDARVPIEDRGLVFGESLYEVIPVAGGKPRLFEAHIERMRQGAEQIGLPGAPSADEWQAIYGELAEAEKIDEGLLYAQLTGGTAPRMHVASEPREPTFFAYLRSFRFPRAEEVARGVRAIKHPDERWGRCDLKTTMLLAATLAKRAAADRGASEALLIGSDGGVREGASSNVFLVEGRSIVTPEQSHHVLPGVTRPFIASLATNAGLGVVRDEPVDVARLERADEVFLTSSSQLAMPVVAIDDRPVGTGSAGPVASDLAARARRAFDIE